jgi:hypothetical protein
LVYNPIVIDVKIGIVERNALIQLIYVLRRDNTVMVEIKVAWFKRAVSPRDLNINPKLVLNI